MYHTHQRPADALVLFPRVLVIQSSELSLNKRNTKNIKCVTCLSWFWFNIPSFLYPHVLQGHEAAFPSPVRSAMLQVVFDRANLSDHSVDDADVSTWLHNRLRPLLVELSPAHVAPFFKILGGRSCSVEQQGYVKGSDGVSHFTWNIFNRSDFFFRVEDLNLTISTLSGMAQKEIHNHIVQTLQGKFNYTCRISCV